MIPVTLVAGCGDDPVARAEFVKQMTDKTPAVGEREWSCVYDELDGDGEVLDRLLELDFGSPVPADLSERVSKLLADCAGVPIGPETVPPVPSTVPSTGPPSLPTTTAPSG